MAEGCEHVVEPVRGVRDPKTGLWHYGRAICSKCGEDLGVYCTQTINRVCPGHKLGDILPHDVCVMCTSPKPTMEKK